MMDFAIWVGEGDLSVRVDDACHTKVLPNALPSLLIFCFQLSRHFSAVFF